MNKTFSYAIGVSLAIHVTLLAGLPVAVKQDYAILPKQETEIKITPQKIEKILKIKDKDFSQIKSPPYLNNSLNHPSDIETKKASTLSKPQLLKASNKEVSLISSVKDDSMKKNPAYMDYYRLIREKIRRNAFRYYDSGKTGEVMMSFIILQSGSLEEVSLNENSINDKNLQNIAIESVNKAAPFPPFPEELKNYPRLKFNIYIQFKND